MALAESTELAYERAFQTHWGDVFRFALAWTNDWAAAEDLAQEAFLRLWDNRGRLDWDRPVLPWLLVIDPPSGDGPVPGPSAPAVAVTDAPARDDRPGRSRPAGSMSAPRCRPCPRWNAPRWS